MPGGRPAGRGHDPDPALAELAAWFKQVINGSGQSINEFVVRNGLDKNMVYGVTGATKLPKPEVLQGWLRLLARDPAEADPIWWRAKEAWERAAEAKAREKQPQLKSWLEIPQPDSALRNLLEGLIEAVDQLPYWLRGIEQLPLSRLYVRQRLRPDSGPANGETGKGRERQEARPDPADDRPRTDATGTDTTLSVADALNGSTHLLVTGEPGAGKSTLGHHLTLSLARIWLRLDPPHDPPLAQPVVPLRIPARTVAAEDAKGWSSVLAEAARRTLGPLPVVDPSPHQFSGRTQGAPWLIVIDGLDEILDRTTRSAIIRAIARHARTGEDYRFIITTRPLPDEELTPLRAGNVAECHLEPFKHDDLRLFAAAWFAAQDSITAEHHTADFLRQVEDRRLRDLVRNPLLATIAALVYTKDPDRSLPTNRVDLYERFFEYLVTDDEAHRRETVTELRRFRDPARLQFAEWVHARRVTIIEVLAGERLDTEIPLNDAACAWVREHKPQDMGLPPGWEEDLIQLLGNTGVFVREGTGLRFLHHTFAEFLAARVKAADIPPVFPDLDDWIQRGLEEAQRTFVLLTFVLWGRRPGNEIGLVLRRLLQGNPECVLLAGRLLAESSTVSGEDSAEVVDRLIDLALGNAPEYELNYPPPAVKDAESVFEVLSSLKENSQAASRLNELTARGELPTPTRIHAAAALGLVADTERALASLTALAETPRQPRERVLIAENLLKLASDRADLARSLLLGVAHDPHAKAEWRIEAAEKLAEIGEHPHAAETALAVLADPTADNFELRTAAKLLLNEDGSAALAQKIADAAKSPSGRRSTAQRVLIAKELANFGHTDRAVPIIRDVLADPMTGATDLGDAAEVWVTAIGNHPLEDVLALVRRHHAAGPASFCELAEASAEVGNTELAIRLAREILTDPQAGGSYVGRAFTVWLTSAGDSALDTMLDLLRQRPAFDPWAGFLIARAVNKAGHKDLAIRMARDVIIDPGADNIDVGAAAEVWLSAANPDALAEVLSTVEQRPGLPPAYRADLASKLSDLRHYEAAANQALQALGDVSIRQSDLGEAVEALMKARGIQAAEDVLSVLDACSAPVGNRLAAADRLATAGALTTAARIWCERLTELSTAVPDQLRALSRLVETGQREQAVAALRQALDDDDLPSSARARLRSLLAWATLVDPDAETCGLCPISGPSCKCPYRVTTPGNAVANNDGKAGGDILP
ncbi:NACHT domain-containing protein [Actinomadura litoris]|uniref:NACHT domain-containing protein n=1 Tax=Actinomadura litoris TaxID=2678616 RepID=A0A7K1LAQ3_9ACTN|nr:hypothetical protein [Actinomadura litoris]MUN41511.1 hypothetical protein [Actinomadura litoris]